MTNPKPANPQPTPGVGSDLYVVLRSKTSPKLNALYDTLLGLGWRYDNVHVTWWTPVGAPEAFGRLEYSPDLEWARIQAPSVVDEALSPPLRRGPELLALVRDGDVWSVAS